jgi:hypothetical protein
MSSLPRPVCNNEKDDYNYEGDDLETLTPLQRRNEDTDFLGGFLIHDHPPIVGNG